MFPDVGDGLCAVPNGSPRILAYNLPLPPTGMVTPGATTGGCPYDIGWSKNEQRLRIRFAPWT